MKTPEAFTPDQLTALAHEVRRGGRAVCPECGSAVDQRPVPPRSDVSYVRDRVWLVCPTCHRSGVIDRRDVGHG